MPYSLLHKLRIRLLSGLIPEGTTGIAILGHRFYVGGQWERIGRLQFDFMVQQGLKPSDCFLDVACGALRGGVHFIRYLDEARYLGIDKEANLINAGVQKELGAELLATKKPEFIVSSTFEFNKFSQKPKYSIATGLFTHLNAEHIELCFKNLRSFVDRGHIFYTTFFEGNSSNNRPDSHSLDHFEYSREEMITMGRKYSWDSHYIGDWRHPRNVMMMRCIAS